MITCCYHTLIGNSIIWILSVLEQKYLKYWAFSVKFHLGLNFAQCLFCFCVGNICTIFHRHLMQHSGIWCGCMITDSSGCRMKGDTLAGPLEMTVYSALQKLYEIENTKKLKRPHLSVVKERTRPSSDSEAATVYKLKGKSSNMRTSQGFK